MKFWKSDWNPLKYLSSVPLKLAVTLQEDYYFETYIKKIMFHFVGPYSWLIWAFYRDGLRNPHVCIAMVPDTVYCQVSSSLGIPYIGHVFVRGNIYTLLLFGNLSRLHFWRHTTITLSISVNILINICNV